MLDMQKEINKEEGKCREKLNGGDMSTQNFIDSKGNRMYLFPTYKASECIPVQLHSNQPKIQSNWLVTDVELGVYHSSFSRLIDSTLLLVSQPTAELKAGIRILSFVGMN